jgi:hypothetical protein
MSQFRRGLFEELACLSACLPICLGPPGLPTRISQLGRNRNPKALWRMRTARIPTYIARLTSVLMKEASMATP